MRKYKRQIAKARLKAMGVGNVNRKLKHRENGEQPLWRRVLDGDLMKQGLAAQLSQGIRSRRKIRRVASNG